MNWREFLKPTVWKLLGFFAIHLVLVSILLCLFPCAGGSSMQGGCSCDWFELPGKVLIPSNLAWIVWIAIGGYIVVAISSYGLFAAYIAEIVLSYLIICTLIYYFDKNAKTKNSPKNG